MLLKGVQICRGTPFVHLAAITMHQKAPVASDGNTERRSVSLAHMWLKHSMLCSVMPHFLVAALQTSNELTGTLGGMVGAEAPVLISSPEHLAPV